MKGLVDFLYFIYSDVVAMIGFILTLSVILWGTASVIRAIRQPFPVESSTLEEVEEEWDEVETDEVEDETIETEN